VTRLTRAAPWRCPECRQRRRQLVGVAQGRISRGEVTGIGFALSAYCPGTEAAALGQGNLDAFGMILGLLTGSYLFALASAPLSRTVGKWADRGMLALPDILHVPR
jgi:hypothetical protein